MFIIMRPSDKDHISIFFLKTNAMSYETRQGRGKKFYLYVLNFKVEQFMIMGKNYFQSAQIVNLSNTNC